MVTSTVKSKKGLADNPLVIFFAAIVFGVWWTLRWSWRILRAPLVGPAVMLTAAGAGLWWLEDWWAATIFASLIVLILAGVWWWDLKNFRSYVRVSWRYLSVYWPKWKLAMRGARLKSLDPEDPDVLPKLQEMRGNEYIDTVTAKMLPNQTVDMFVSKSAGIAQTLGASGCRAVRNARSVHLVDLWLWRDDPLKKLNPKPFPIPEPPVDGNWYRWFQTQMRYGIYEDGSRAGIDLTQRHWFVVGKSRAGKSSSRIWPVVRMSIPMVQDHALRYCVNDWKEGLELQAGRPIFEANSGWFSTSLEESAERLTGEVNRMLAQAHQMGVNTENAKSAKDITRKLDWLDADFPWTVVVADELKTVMNGLGHQQARKTIVSAFLLIQQIGLACGYTLVAGSQKGHKDVLGELRDDFTAMDCLAVEYASETYMLFDKMAIEQYAIEPHLLHIPEPEDEDQSGDQGIGWRRRPGYPRVRGTNVTDEDIWDLRMLLPGAWDQGESVPEPEEDEEPEYNVMAPPVVEPPPPAGKLKLTRSMR
jgi:hypothetical protein